MATLYQGSPDRMPHTPSTDVTAGDVVVLGDLVGVVVGDCDSGGLGTVYVQGGVIVVDKTDAEAYTVGAALYWDAGNSCVTSTASTHNKIGEAAVAAASSDTEAYVYLNPGPAAAA